MSGRLQNPQFPRRPDRPPLSRTGSFVEPQVPQQPTPPQNQQPRYRQPQYLQPQYQQPHYHFQPLTPSEIPYTAPKGQIPLFSSPAARNKFAASMQRADPARMAALNAMSDKELWMKVMRKWKSWTPGDDQRFHEWLEVVRHRPGLWKRKTGCEFGFVSDGERRGGGCVVC
jgi:hypothetical protein